VLRPLPPFRAEPLKKPAAPKPGVRQTGINAVKASRQSIRVTRASDGSGLKVLGRPTSNGQG